MIITKQFNRRDKEANNLRNFLQNPGLFSILILGAPGVGKSFWVEKFQKELSAENATQASNNCFEKFLEVSLGYVKASKKAWKKILEKAAGGILLINQLEKVKPHEDILFELLTTEDGTFGFEEKHKLRFAFSYSGPISELKKDEKVISNRLFDRIAQLVVEFPSFSESNETILNDFEATWEKMKFKEFGGFPSSPSLENWLKTQCYTFAGNFRDLDKIAILWHQHRLMGRNENSILESVAFQFSKYSSYPEPPTPEHDTFIFQKGKTKEQIEIEFRIAFKNWAISTYGSLKDASEVLDMSHRTMERW